MVEARLANDCVQLYVKRVNNANWGNCCLEFIKDKHETCSHRNFRSQNNNFLVCLIFIVDLNHGNITLVCLVFLYHRLDLTYCVITPYCMSWWCFYWFEHTGLLLSLNFMLRSSRLKSSPTCQLYEFLSVRIIEIIKSAVPLIRPRRELQWILLFAELICKWDLSRPQMVDKKISIWYFK